jgi:hypothetical protein
MLATRDHTKPTMMRIGIIMLSLGWRKRRIRMGNDRGWIYERDEATS